MVIFASSILIPLLALFLYCVVFSPHSSIELMDFLLNGIFMSNGKLDVIKAIYWFWGTTAICFISMIEINRVFNSQIWMVSYRFVSKSKFIITVIIKQIRAVLEYWIMYFLFLYLTCLILLNGFEMTFLPTIFITFIYSICIILTGYLFWLIYPKIELTISVVIITAVFLSIEYSIIDKISIIRIEAIWVVITLFAIYFLSKDSKIYERVCSYVRN